MPIPLATGPAIGYSESLKGLEEEPVTMCQSATVVPLPQGTTPSPQGKGHCLPLRETLFKAQLPLTGLGA